MVFLQFTINKKGIVKNRKMQGRDYLVVPMVMITHGVHAGSGGPLYYPDNELKKTASLWNNKPVVVNHPEVDGEPVSACDAEVLTECGVGVVMNTKYSKGKLTAEAWLEKSRIEIVDNRILERLEDEDPVEVSTGLFTVQEDTPGSYGNKPYDAIARELQPDHLALLMDSKGACGVKDGCGLKVNKECSCQKNNSKTPKNNMTKNELSFGQTSEALRTVLWGTDYSKGWIKEVWDDHAVYVEDGEMREQHYAVVDDAVVLVGSPVTVRETITYEPVTNEQVDDKKLEEGDPSMLKKDLVKYLIGNCGYNATHQAVLEASDEKVLKKAVDDHKASVTANAEDPEDEGDGDEGNDPVTNTKGKKPAAAPAKKKAPATTVANEDGQDHDVETFLNTIPTPLRTLMRNGINALRAEVDGLVATITANKANTFTEDHLLKMAETDLDTLRGLAAIAKTAVVANTEDEEYAPRRRALFFGQQGGNDSALIDNADEEEEVLVVKRPAFAKK